jgi:UDP-glucose 4-epimerase
VSTPALVRLLARALGRPARLLPVPASLLRLLGRISGKTGAVARLTDSLQVDAAHLRNTLGWRPIASLPQGLAATARWYSTSVARASAAPEEAR